MPFTATQVVIFFEDQAYMALTRCTATALAAEGIAIPDNLSNYDKEVMNLIYWNQRKPTKVPWDGMAGARGELCEIQAYKLLAISQICLTSGAITAKFYDDIGHALDPDNMLWTVPKRFDKQHKEWMARKVGDSMLEPSKIGTYKTYPYQEWLHGYRAQVT
jgi:hypothetical protein